MEVKKSYKADIEHKRPLIFCVALVGVTLVFVAILFIPYKSIYRMSQSLFDDYTPELELKIQEEDDMISAAIPEVQKPKEEPTRLNKVEEAVEPLPEQIEVPQPTPENAKEVEQETEPPVNLNGDDEEKRRIVEELPEYPGGMVEFMKWLTATLKYPNQALRNKQQGKVIVSFIVETDGSITNIKVTKSAGRLLDAEALRVARLMPQWNPGTSDGKPCRSMVAIPVVFEI